jgi:amino acid permease
MNWLKIVLVCLGLIFGVYVLFWLIGIVSALLWYLFVAATFIGAGYVGYRLLKRDHKPELEGRTNVSQLEFDDARDERALEEYRRKYLNK